ncbi:MAG: GIY-YIG nuclease family protein [bacterium]
MFTVYAIYSPSIDRLYIGQTGDFKNRLRAHREGGSGFTSRATDWIVVYTERYATRQEAIRRERQLKSFRGREFLRKRLK